MSGGASSGGYTVWLNNNNHESRWTAGPRERYDGPADFAMKVWFGPAA